MPSTETRRMIMAAAAACEDKKAEDTRILELDPMDSGFTDFFLITSGSNDRQTVAISDEIEQRLKRDFGVYPHSVEGRRLGEWILLDYFDFVVHIFMTEKRAFYDIERLRKSARSVDVAELKAALAEKVKAVRSKVAKPGASSTKDRPASPAASSTAKKTADRKIGADSLAGKKSVAKKAAVKKLPARKVAIKRTTVPVAKSPRRRAPRKNAGAEISEESGT